MLNTDVILRRPHMPVPVSLMPECCLAISNVGLDSALGSGDHRLSRERHLSHRGLYWN